MSSSKAPTPNEREIIGQFNAKRQRLQAVDQKLQELKQEISEHEMVIRALEPMDAGRRCFRLVGDVLVERTVGETLPAVIKNKANLDVAVQTIQETFESLEKELTEFQNKNQIKIVDRAGRVLDLPSDPEGGKPAAKSGQGVLVKK